MGDPDLLYPLAIGLGMAIAAAGAVALLRAALGPTVRAGIERYETTFVFVLQWRRITEDHVWLILAGMVAAAVAFGAAVSVLGGALVGAAFGTALLFLLVLVPLVVATPLYELRRRRRGREIDDVLPALLQQLSANLSNNKNIGLALEEVSRTAPAPMDYELRLLAQKERDLGSLPAALDEANERIRSDWFGVTSAILKTTYERASSEGEVLQNLSRVFAQQRAMRDKIDTATRQGETSIKIMAVVPFLVVLVAPFAMPASTWQHANMPILWTVVVFGLLVAVTAIGLAMYFKGQDV
jgi:tight adherence protein B